MVRLSEKLLKIKHEKDIEEKISDEQAYFSAIKSCIDHIFTLQQVMERKRKKKPMELHGLY